MPYSDLLRGRASIGGQIYLVTTVTRDRAPLFTNLSEVIKAVKGKSSYEINRSRKTNNCVWQPSFHDHALRKEEDLQDVARYVVCNPLRAGLVRELHDYSPWDAVWVGGESG